MSCRKLKMCTNVCDRLFGLSKTAREVILLCCAVFGAQQTCTRDSDGNHFSGLDMGGAAADRAEQLMFLVHSDIHTRAHALMRILLLLAVAVYRLSGIEKTTEHLGKIIRCVVEHLMGGIDAPLSATSLHWKTSGSCGLVFPPTHWSSPNLIKCWYPVKGETAHFGGSAQRGLLYAKCPEIWCLAVHRCIDYRNTCFGSKFPAGPQTDGVGAGKF